MRWAASPSTSTRRRETRTAVSSSSPSTSSPPVTSSTVPPRSTTCGREAWSSTSTAAGRRNSRLGSVLDVKQPDAEEVLARLRQFGPTPTQQNGPKPSEIRVRVFNGSGQSGQAATTGTALQQQGFVTAGVGNQPRVSATQIHYRTGSLDKARVVQSYLGGVGKLVEDKSIVPADGAVILGQDFKGVTPPPHAASPDSTAPPAPPAPPPAPTTT